MRVWQTVSITLIVGLLSFSYAFGEKYNNEWKKVKESDGIICYTRPTSLTNVDEVKAVGMIDASVAVIEAVLRDIPAQTEYMFKCDEAFIADIPGLEDTKDTIYIYNKTNMPWPLHDRDGIARTEFMVDEATGVLFMKAQGISTDFERDKKIVRIPIATVTYTLVPIDQDKTEITYTILGDPAGKLPSSLVNMFSKNLGGKTVSGIREMVKKDRYKNAKSLVTTTPWVR